jgi:hypothetical protein
VQEQHRIARTLVDVVQPQPVLLDVVRCEAVVRQVFEVLVGCAVDVDPASLRPNAQRVEDRSRATHERLRRARSYEDEDGEAPAVVRELRAAGTVPALERRRLCDRQGRGREPLRSSTRAQAAVRSAGSWP